MTYTSSYQSQVPGSSVYSPFNRNGAGAPPGVSNPAYGDPMGSPFPVASMGSDAFVPVASPEDMDRVVSSIDDKIARIRQAFNQQPSMPIIAAPQTSAAAAVSQEEIQWALQLEQKVKGGQQPTAQETARYEDIARRLAAAQQQPQQTPAPQAPAAAAVSQEEIQWALQLEQKVKGGQQPTAQEIARYEDIARRLAAAQQQPQQTPAPQAPAAAVVSQEEIQWALQLEQKVKGGQQPTAQETARYEDIARRLAAAQQQSQQTSATQPTAGTRDWANWSKPFAPPAASAMPLPIAAPGNGQPVVTIPTSLRAAPQIPPAVAMTQSVPPTLPQQAVTSQMPSQPLPQPQISAPPAPQMTVPAQAPQSSGNVSQQEIQWALQLEQKVNQQKYQPTPQEVATYQSIAQRLSTAQQQPQLAPPALPQQAAPSQTPPQRPPQPQISAPPAPQMTVPAQAPQPSGNVSQQEIQWALQLEQRVQQQRYQPTPQEVATYENIAQRLSAAPPQTVPQQRPPGLPQNQQVMMPPTPQQVPIVPQQYPYVQPQTPQYIVPPQPFMPQQPQMPQQGYPQQPGMVPPAQKPGFIDRLKNAWSALWG